MYTYTYVWQGAEGPGGLRTPDSQVIAMRAYPFSQRDIPVAK